MENHNEEPNDHDASKFQGSGLNNFLLSLQFFEQLFSKTLNVFIEGLIIMIVMITNEVPNRFSG